MLMFELCLVLSQLPITGIVSETQDVLFPNSNLQNIARVLKKRVLGLLHRPYLM